MDELIRQSLTAFGPALAIALGLAFLIRSRPDSTPWAEALLVLLPFLWAFLVLHKTWIPNPARSVSHYLPWFGLAATVALVVFRKNQRYQVLASLVVALLFLEFLLGKVRVAYPDWSSNQFLALRVSMALAFGSFALLGLERIAPRQPLARWHLFLAQGLLVGALIGTVLIAGSSRWAQILGALGLACGVGTCLGWLQRKEEPQPATHALLLFLSGGVLVYAFFFIDGIPLLSFLILLLVTPTTLFAGRLTERPLTFLLIQFLLLALAVYLVHTNAPPVDEYGY